jgi:type I restriction enzyme S subunit
MRAEAAGRALVEWQERTVDELCSLRKELVEPSSTGINRYVGLEHLDSGSTQIRRWGNDADLRSTKSRFYPGDVLYGKLRPYLDKAAPAEWEGVCSTDILTLSPRTGVTDSRYLSFLLHTSAFINHAVATTSGVNHPRTSWASIATFTHPTPPLPEQRAIAAVLSKIQAAVEVQEKIVTTLKELKAATMAKLFREGLRGEPLKQTEIGKIPESWQVVRLGEVASIRYGLGQPPKLSEDGVPMIRATDIKRGRIVGEQILRVERQAIPASRKPFLNIGDIIVVRSGAYTGDTAVVTKEWQGAVAGYDLIVTPSNKLDPFFAVNYLLGTKVQIYFRGQRDRSAQPHINSQQLSDTILPLPSLKEQQEIAHVLRTIDGETIGAEGKRDTIKTLFSSMLHLLMTGQVRTIT